jgi:enoyl-CoA hydratase/isomerase-like protein
MEYTHVLIERSGDFATITVNNPAKRNALSREHMRELIAAFTEVGDSDALGVVLAANGPMFSAGHDFADVVDHEHADVRELLVTCTGSRPIRDMDRDCSSPARNLFVRPGVISHDHRDVNPRRPSTPMHVAGSAGRPAQHGSYCRVG